jgi:hypothetical protein
MWFGQQITLELNPRRVLERFLEAVADIAQADGGVVGMVGENDDIHNIHIVVATGLTASLSGLVVPIAGSGMGRVIRSGVPWTVADMHVHTGELADEIYARMRDHVTSLAIVPISSRRTHRRRIRRRGEGSNLHPGGPRANRGDE